MDNNNQYGVLEQQKRLLDFFKLFHAFCVENEIRYSLDWGTLLGAIRDRGFIPWDDDIDIMVDRANYNKLCECLIHKKHSFKLVRTLWISRVRLINDDDDSIYPLTIDLLVMDNAPDGLISRRIRVLFIKLLQGTLKKKPNNINKYKKVGVLMRLTAMFLYYVGLLFSHTTKLSWYDYLAQLSNKKDSKEITSYYEEYSCLGKYYSRNLMNETILVPFEDIQAYVIKDYHNCLVTQFGQDYMIPIKTRLNHTEKHIKKQQLGDA